MEALSLGAVEQQALGRQIRNFNLALNQGREVPNRAEMGRDQFLKILLTQLQTQDPTSPVEDKEFIAQMAQFSSLEQMTNVATEFRRLNQAMISGQALGVLGRNVELATDDGPVAGRVDAVSQGSNPTIRVDGREYRFDHIIRVIQ